MKYISINKHLIPYIFDIEIKDIVYTVEVYYNQLDDYFTLDIYDGDEPIIFGEKLLIGNKIDELDATPTDPTGREVRISFDNLNEQVFLAVGDNDE